MSTEVSPTSTEYDGPVSAEVRESMRTADYYLRQDRGTVPEVLFEQSVDPETGDPDAQPELSPELDRQQ